MTYFVVHDMNDEARQELLDWAVAEGLDPNLIADDGKFSVHNGVVSWNAFLPDVNNKWGRVFNRERNGFVKVHTVKKQETPLPERFL